MIISAFLIVRSHQSNLNLMNRLVVGRSARAQQAHKVDNRIDRLMALHKTDKDLSSKPIVLWAEPARDGR